MNYEFSFSKLTIFISVQASFLNSPMSTSSSNGNMMQNKGRDEGFNAGIFYQKVNENNDDNDLEYTKLISILSNFQNMFLILLIFCFS